MDGTALDFVGFWVPRADSGYVVETPDTASVRLCADRFWSVFGDDWTILAHQFANSLLSDY